jgi:hypothetical protein
LIQLLFQRTARHLYPKNNQKIAYSIALILKINTGSLNAYQLDGSVVADFKFMQPTPSL